ncbi:MAG: F0F1 ATP synthase subunit alpha [Bacteroidales bacterium]|nr:F0F1 ATP synthase subunit alpha [Bacteroidales bacterium]MBQ9529887.1 F0F1 ATP synthase subunit alpha [Bacteroidales bacterium]
MEENIKPSEISKVLLEELRQVDLSAKTEEVGEVLTASDGVVRIWGLNSAEAGELLEFENGEKAVVMNLEVDNVGAVLLGSTDTVKEGDVVRRTYRTASIDVRESMLGRVITPLGEPLDGGGEITGESFRMPLERKAPGVIFRQPVNEPLQTGIKAIDSMIPIGRGQRELIIGDRQTGKTSIAIDTIINQRAGYENGDPVYCIYVAIGQKASTVATIVETLRTYKAMDYTIVIAATAGDSAALRYYAPFAGAAVGEYFRDTGRHALVIYDDLSKQAVAYREVSLILKRPSGREAYPGDIFYLHSRLLERAAKIIGQQEVAEMMNDLPDSMKGRVKAGGSLTALPIIETQAGDVSAYIPTNVISITDGQIFLETDLFNQGNRPAINVGISVSRVGGNAQTKAMKKVAGTLKIDQAQYRELEAFSKYSSDMDAISMMTLDKGRKNTRLLIQPLHAVMPVEKQIAVLYCGTKALMKDIPLEKVPEFERLLLEQLSANETFEQIRTKGITPEVESAIQSAAAAVCSSILNQ